MVIMKKKVGKIVFLILLISGFCYYILTIRMEYKKEKLLLDPFDIKVSNAKILEGNDLYLEQDNFDSLDKRCKRMCFEVTIKNISDKEFKNVWYELSLNKEAEPYIASGITSFTSDKMDVTTFEKAQLMDEKNGIPIISGFTHEWNMLITSEEVLKEYYNLRIESLTENVKFFTVKVYWDGGEQKYVQKLNFSS